MTNVTEAKLAREAGLCYATLAMVTDYDCWHPDHDAVTTEAVIKVLMANVALSKEIVKATLSVIDENATCGCACAAKNAVISHRDGIPQATLAKLSGVVGEALS